MTTNDASRGGSGLCEGLGLAPERARLASCPFAVFDEFGRGADDRVQDYAAALVAAERERCLRLLFQGGAPRSAEYGDWAPVSEAIEKGLRA